MEPFSLKEVADFLNTAAPCDAEIRCVSTDTRNLPEGCLFLALRGKRFDGHDFVKAALEAGAVAAVTDTQIEDLPCLIVKDTGKALLDIGNFYRRQFRIPLVGVTGSVGKTTTKEMIACALSEKFCTLKTAQNFNNEIGMPKTLFGLTREHGAAVIEMGMSHFGEISNMSRSAMPTIAVITNIGYSHIENLGSQEGILKAKLEMLEGMEADAPLITSADDAMLAPLKTSLDRPVYTFSTAGNPADVTAWDIREENGVTTFTIRYNGSDHLAVLPAIGEHNVKNALAAFMAGILTGMEVQEILCGLAKYQPTGNRQNIMEKDGQTVIADCYNASPDSMRAGIGVLNTLPCSGRRIAVLADMLELGEHSDALHAMVGEMVKNSDIDILFCYGAAARHIAENAGDSVKTYCTTDADELTAMISGTVQEGDCVFFKGSHGMHLETIISRIYGEL